MEGVERCAKGLKTNDPQDHYDPDMGMISMTITASKDGVARILNIRSVRTCRKLMVGWARRSESATSTRSVTTWAGNLTVQKIVQKENGDLVPALAERIAEQFQNSCELLLEDTSTSIEADSPCQYVDAFTCYERFMLTCNFTYEGDGSFGLCFDYIQLLFNEGSTLITEMEIGLTAGEKYSFTYILEGSVGVFYIDDMAALTVRLYGVTGKPVKLLAENKGSALCGACLYDRDFAG